eukprot:scaffold771_cov170-Amphora_coffeaeformis.AAC.11
MEVLGGCPDNCALYPSHFACLPSPSPIEPLSTNINVARVPYAMSPIAHLPWRCPLPVHH